MADEPSVPDELASRIDTTVPHSARIWNYWLGGKDNYEVDRAAGEQYCAVFPSIVDLARSSRGFLTRSVRFLAAEAGIRQFLDSGTGLPTADNTHQVAQRAAPDARIVYVDNDPLVLAHARALLTSTPEGATDYIDADLRDVDAVLRGARPADPVRNPAGRASPAASTPSTPSAPPDGRRGLRGQRGGDVLQRAPGTVRGARFPPARASAVMVLPVLPAF